MDPALYTPRVALWSQRDWRWAKKYLGKSGVRMGEKGCVVTVLSMIILRWYWDIYKKNPPKVWRPGDLCDWMSKEHQFTAQGDAYLNTVDIITQGKCINVYDPAQAHYTMVMVMWGESGHWVLKLRDDLCLDPWDATIKKLEQPKWRVTNGRRYFKVVH